ncbi:MAG: hypothetical protein QOD11_1332 [Bradyrhizobium sp.]|jgi:hypothetical protein|nr:hypothetical protein [Bradyrhizobium sp.]
MRFRTPTSSLENKLDDEAKRMKEAASHLPFGSERDKLLKKSRQLAVAAHINEWLSSPGLRPPQGAK